MRMRQDPGWQFFPYAHEGLTPNHVGSAARSFDLIHYTAWDCTRCLGLYIASTG